MHFSRLQNQTIKRGGCQHKILSEGERARFFDFHRKSKRANPRAEAAISSQGKSTAVLCGQSPSKMRIEIITCDILLCSNIIFLHQRRRLKFRIISRGRLTFPHQRNHQCLLGVETVLRFTKDH